MNSNEIIQTRVKPMKATCYRGFNIFNSMFQSSICGVCMLLVKHYIVSLLLFDVTQVLLQIVSIAGTAN